MTRCNCCNSVFSCLIFLIYLLYSVCSSAVMERRGIETLQLLNCKQEEEKTLLTNFPLFSVMRSFSLEFVLLESWMNVWLSCFSDLLFTSVDFNAQNPSFIFLLKVLLMSWLDVKRLSMFKLLMDSRRERWKDSKEVQTSFNLLASLNCEFGLTQARKSCSEKERSWQVSDMDSLAQIPLLAQLLCVKL